MQTLVPRALLYFPASHSTQASRVGLPSGAYVFGIQLIQALLPTELLYFPASHITHDPALGPVKPALHSQAPSAVLPIAEIVLSGHSLSHTELPSKAWKVPTGHIVHAAGPVVFLNVPAAHSVHTAPFAPVYPALHLHAPLPTGESELRGHS